MKNRGIPKKTLLLFLFIYSVIIYGRHKNTNEETGFDSKEELHTVLGKKIKSALEDSFKLRLSYNLSKSEEDFMKEYMNEMLERRNRIKKYCDKHRKLWSPPHGMNLFWIRRKHAPNIMWCCNFKAGSGSWVAHFMRETLFDRDFNSSQNNKMKLFNFEHSTELSHEALRKMHPEPVSEEERKLAFNNSIRFINVRHPFTRVLSGYRDFVTPSHFDPIEEKKLRSEIVKNYRSNTSLENQPFPTFSEYIDYIIDTTAKFKTPEDWYNFSKDILGQYLKPFWSQCNVCDSDYHVVFKLETVKKDKIFFAILANLKSIKKIRSREWQNLIHGRTSYEVSSNYYHQLTKEQISKLFEIYEHDFELFGYDVKAFL